MDVWQEGREDEFTPGERVIVPAIHEEGRFVRRDPMAWIVEMGGYESGWRFIEHRPVLDRIVEATDSSQNCGPVE
jgi:hypothetical protein